MHLDSVVWIVVCLSLLGYLLGANESEAPNQLATELGGIQLPPNLDLHSVFLMMPTCASGEEVCAAVQTLLDHGAQEASIFFVCIVSAIATSRICHSWPGTKGSRGVSGTCSSY